MPIGLDNTYADRMMGIVCQTLENNMHLFCFNAPRSNVAAAGGGDVRNADTQAAPRAGTADVAGGQGLRGNENVGGGPDGAK